MTLLYVALFIIAKSVGVSRQTTVAALIPSFVRASSPKLAPYDKTTTSLKYVKVNSDRAAL